MANALWITLIGMGMVFAAILLLWGLMELIVRLTTEKKPITILVASEEGYQEPVETGQQKARKQRAAVAAVASALALHKQAEGILSNPSLPGATLSAWQAAHRAGAIGQQLNSGKAKGTR